VASQNACWVGEFRIRDEEMGKGDGVRDGTHLPLGWEVTETSGDAEEEGVIRGEDLRGDDGVFGFSRGVHLGEDLGGEGLRDSFGALVLKANGVVHR